MIIGPSLADKLQDTAYDLHGNEKFQEIIEMLGVLDAFTQKRGALKSGLDKAAEAVTAQAADKFNGAQLATKPHGGRQ